MIICDRVGMITSLCQIWIQDMSVQSVFYAREILTRLHVDTDSVILASELGSLRVELVHMTIQAYPLTTYFQTQWHLGRYSNCQLGS